MVFSAFASLERRVRSCRFLLRNLQLFHLNPFFINIILQHFDYLKGFHIRLPQSCLTSLLLLHFLIIHLLHQKVEALSSFIELLTILLFLLGSLLTRGQSHLQSHRI